VDSLGHHLGYSHAVGKAARGQGMDAVILANHAFQPPANADVVYWPVFRTLYQSAGRSSAVRALAYSLAAHLPHGLGHSVAQSMRAARRFTTRSRRATDSMGAELTAALAALGATTRDVLLLHSVSSANLFGLAKSLPRSPAVRLAIVLRRTPQDMDQTDAAPVPIAQVLRELAVGSGRGCRLYADTEPLADIYTSLTGIAVSVAPLPVVVPPVESFVQDPTPHLVFAGGARAEKGYGVLPGLVSGLRGRARFTIHCGPVGAESDPRVQQAHRALMDLTGPDVRLLERALSPTEYQALIADAHLLLLPYDAPTYGPRSSGILAEARAMGIPAVVPAETWMATAAGPSPDVIFKDPGAFRETVDRCLRSLPDLTALYRAAAGTWRARHNPDALLRVLCGSGDAPAGRAGVIRPGGPVVPARDCPV